MSLQGHDRVRPVAIALRQAADRNHVAGAIRPGGQSLCAGVQSTSPLVPGSGTFRSFGGRVLFEVGYCGRALPVNGGPERPDAAPAELQGGSTE